jgi:4-aminobutyrate aminotransferase-like enzyme
VSNYKFETKPRNVPTIQTEFRNISTAIPAPGTEEILASLSANESRSMHGQLPLVWASALDSSIYDIAGNKFIDFTSTIFVANVGHGNKRVIDYVNEAMSKPLLSTYAYANRYRDTYIQKLLKFTEGRFQKAFLMSAGTESTEAALKLMRLNGIKNSKGKNIVLSLSGNWHGRTMGAQSLSDNATQKKWTGEESNFIRHLPFPYPWLLNKMTPIDFLRESLIELEKTGINIAKDISGIMLESFQGWGAFFYPKEYVQEIRRICDQNDILLCFDEMQAGFGRTGLKFGYLHYEVEADLICCGKGMGGGFPLSGVLGSAEIMDLPEVGNMSSTHSGNPVVCAAGMAVIDEINDRDLVAHSKNKGELLHQELRKMQFRFSDKIAYTTGIGLIAAVIFNIKDTKGTTSEAVSWIAERCMEKGLLVVHTGRESIKIGPPLVITEPELIEGLSILSETLEEVFGLRSVKNG